MADGTKIGGVNFNGGISADYLMLDNAGATDTGAWVDFNTYVAGSIEFTGTFVATAQIMGSNAPAIPANATDGTQIGANVTTPSLVAITIPVKWIKVKLSAWTSGNVSAVLHAIS